MEATAAPVRDLMPARQSPVRVSLVRKFATRFNIEEDKLLPILKSTAFKQKKGEVSNEQMAALLIVADQYGLNPFTREIFAFPDKQNGIVPVVSVDGWARIINEHLMMDGLDFRYSDELIKAGDPRCPDLKIGAFEWMESIIYRKDRSRPIVVREYFEEVYRQAFTFDDGNKKEGAWQSHPKRFHRHKTLIQGGRLAFGFGGIYDADEAHRIVEGTVLPTDPQPPADRLLGAAGLADALGVSTVVVGASGINAANAAAQDQDGATLAGATDPEPAAAASTSSDIPPRANPTKPAGTVEQRNEFTAKFKQCADAEALHLQRDAANAITWTPADQTVIDEAYKNRLAELGG